jgi:3-oxoacyl-[acyl-carrier-protein] synthase-1
MALRGDIGSMSVAAVGMACSLGADAPSTCAAIRAGVARFEEIPFRDTEGRAIIGAPAPEVVSGRQGFGRVLALLNRALAECAESYLRDRSGRAVRLSLLINLDSPNSIPPDARSRVLAELARIPALAQAETRIYTAGKTGVFQCIAAARQLLAGGATACIVAAADSFLNARALLALETDERLKTETNFDGVIPGEGAAAFALETSADGQDSYARLIGLGFGNEESVQKNTPNLARGLAQALKGALADAGADVFDIDFRVGCVTGEQAAFCEASTAFARVQRKHKDDFALLLPAETLGDVGVALPACAVVNTAIGFRRRYAPGRSAIVFGSSAGAERAACVMVC